MTTIQLHWIEQPRSFRILEEVEWKSEPVPALSFLEAQSSILYLSLLLYR